MAISFFAIDGLRLSTFQSDHLHAETDKIERRGGLVFQSESIIENQYSVLWWNGQDPLSIAKNNLEEVIKLLTKNGLWIAGGTPLGADRLTVKIEKYTSTLPLINKVSSCAETQFQVFYREKKSSKGGYTRL